ncbi:putative colanic acid biosynthesis acetyltransferase [Bacillus toyonensis]|uniref:putative colanic acid biosynthesis acetyltransferase n=1 Tax=Bacillus toyonensis TaxID=155322 RepID=UPI000BF0C64D|nr:putative colanic acid biosynthesis acetyltransferase [Bacillus toyonensis]PEJ65952.1 colanic acid biosynthesis acetyltransferase WcaF [Bacillus toyonensis]PEN73259.1 colanic acid biosynthesis acetyltransferase WcaF [Bacillus toyonensis]PGB35496.1 colanic acid biosynthesis acetyltransferase WcaF [Bacillus toyonensis]
MNIDLSKYNQSWYSRGRNSLVVLIWWFIQGTIFRYSIHNMYKWRSFLLRLFGAKIGGNVKIRPTAQFTYPWKISIGDNSWIGDNVKFYSLEEIHIGANCVISQESYLCTGSHDPKDPYFGLITKPIHVKDGAWIASNVFIYPGVTIHKLGIAAARSTVLKDIPTNEIHAGFPATFIKKRFEEEELK